MNWQRWFGELRSFSGEPRRSVDGDWGEPSWSPAYRPPSPWRSLSSTSFVVIPMDLAFPAPAGGALEPPRSSCPDTEPFTL